MSVWSPCPAAATASAAHLLRLRELALKRICLDKSDVGARFGMSVLRRGVEAHQIPWNQLEIFQAQRGGAAGALRPRLLQQVDTFSPVRR